MKESNCNGCEYSRLIGFSDKTNGRGCAMARSAIKAVYNADVDCGLAGLSLLADPITKEADTLFAVGIVAQIIERSDTPSFNADPNQLILDFSEQTH